MDTPQDITEEQFFEVVDRFIHQANEFGQRFPQSRISAAFLFAAARYNAFQWVNRSQLLEQTPDEAALAFRAEYESMFRDNVRSLSGARPNA
jgi:hypothetical protein